MRNPTKDEISYVKRQLRTQAISKRKRENYRIWLFIVGWKSGDGDKFQAAGEKFFPKDSGGQASKQKAYYRCTVVEKQLAQRPSKLQKLELLHFARIDNALWASPSWAWLSPPGSADLSTTVSR